MSRTFSGLKDWAIQRVSAVYMVVYIFMLLGYFVVHPDLQYTQWKHFFELIYIQIATLIMLLAMMWHAWIGMWTILTDYVKVSCVQITLQILIILALIAFFFWGVEILWHVNFIW